MIDYQTFVGRVTTTIVNLITPSNFYLLGVGALLIKDMLWWVTFQNIVKVSVEESLQYFNFLLFFFNFSRYLRWLLVAFRHRISGRTPTSAPQGGSSRTKLPGRIQWQLHLQGKHIHVVIGVHFVFIWLAEAHMNLIKFQCDTSCCQEERSLTTGITCFNVHRRKP